LQLTGNSFAHILHDLRMLMAKAALTASCRFPQLPLFGYLFLLVTEPTRTALFLIIRVIGLRFPQIELRFPHMKLD
jgi:hypothetical protein